MIHYRIELENVRDRELMVISVKILFIGASVAVIDTPVRLPGVIFSELLVSIVSSHFVYACGAFNSPSLNEFTKPYAALPHTSVIPDFINGFWWGNFMEACRGLCSFLLIQN